MAADSQIAVFLDYDGTLSPIADRPDDAVISDSMRAAVRQLGECCPVAVVSGRNVVDVRSRVALTEIGYAGSHGIDFMSAEGQIWHHPDAPAFLPDLDSAEIDLRTGLSLHRGVEIERKRYSVAVHYRRVDSSEIPAIEYTVRQVTESHPRLFDTPGKMVHDLRPDISWNKGESVLWMLDRLGLVGPEALPIYIGDDVTDEDAFAVLETKGVGIVVRDGEAASRASYSLRDNAEVHRFLIGLTAALKLLAHAQASGSGP